MDESDLFKKVLIKDDQHVVYTNLSETVIYQEHIGSKSLNERQIKQIHDLLSNGKFSGYLIKVNGGNLIPFEDETWVEKLNLSVLHDAGILFMAYISPQNIFSSLEIEKEIVPDTNKSIRIKTFKDSEEAILWLKSHLINFTR